MAHSDLNCFYGYLPMPKLDIEFELTGLKLKIKGETDDASGKVAELQNQVQRLVGLVGALSQNGGTTPLPGPNAAPQKLLEGQTQSQPAAKPKRSSARRGSAAPRAQAEAIDFRHDADRYGFPKQAWSTAQKSMWLLATLSGQGVAGEMSSAVIAATFNKHFRSFGTILKHNVARDLGKEKGKGGGVNSDTTQDPEKWFLLEAGKKQVEALIADAKGTSSE